MHHISETGSRNENSNRTVLKIVVSSERSLVRSPSTYEYHFLMRCSAVNVARPNKPRAEIEDG